MSINPILRREVTVQSRSFSLPAMVFGINALLFIAGLSGTFGLVARMRYGMETAYGSFILIYALVMFLMFLLLLFVTPSLTAGSISLERSSQTLDLLLTTQMSPAGIIFGKLSASVLTLFTLLISAVPAMMLPLLYGGVSVPEVAGMWLVFAGEALVLLSVGLFASSLSSHTVRTTAAAYGITAGLCAGIPAAALILSPFAETGKNYAAYLLVFDPLSGLLGMLAGQTGRTGMLSALFTRLSLEPGSAFLRFFVPLSLGVQLTMSFILLLVTIIRITPRQRKKLVKQKWV